MLALFVPALLLSTQVTLPLGAAVLLICHLSAGPEPRPPHDWEAVDTHFGSIAHGQADPILEYQVSQEIQNRALASKARVIIFPESVAPHWTSATDLFWQDTFTALSTSGKTLLVGASLDDLSRRPDAAPAEITNYDFTGAVAALRSVRADAGQSVAWEPVKPSRYRNAVLMRGTETGTFLQRIPVPLGMWHPFSNAGVP